MNFHHFYNNDINKKQFKDIIRTTCVVMINRKYKLLEQIGEGNFGSIFKAQNIRTRELVAVKRELISQNLHMLLHEANIYQYLKGCNRVPTIKWFGKDETYYYMVVSLIGESLQQQAPFSLHDTMEIGIQALGILKQIHELGLVHRDIKPHNWLLDKDRKDVYLIDFGLSKLCSTNATNKSHHLIGSKNYASISAHLRHELSRRDDVESLIYVLMYCCTGHLPWSSVANEDDIVELKRHVFSEAYPDVFLECLRIVQGLDFSEAPNYQYMISRIRLELSK